MLPAVIVDLAQIQDGPLYRPAARHSPVLNNAEVPVILAVLLSICASQEHRNSSMP
jgi:hypothetical protein